MLALALLFAGGCLADGHRGGTECTDGTMGPNVDLTVVDATTAAPLAFTVTVDGAAPELAVCVAAPDGGVPASMPPCFAEMQLSLIGSHVVTVSSEAHAATTLPLDAGILTGPCGSAPARSVTLTLALR